MKIRLFIIVILTVITVYAQQMNITLFTTDNIFMSSDREADGGVEWNLSIDSNNDKTDMYMDIGVYLPFIHYELVSFPYNAGITAQWIDNTNIMLSSNVYLSGQWHMGYYYENTFEMPGIYNYVEYNPNYMISLSAYNDIYAEIYNDIPELNRIIDRQHISLQFFFPWRLALHINAEGGWMYMYNDNTKSTRYTINPLISAGITDNIGIFCSGSISSVSDGSMPYYYDDSFINDFFYNENSLSGGITLIDIVADRIRLGASYTELYYLELISDSSSVQGIIPSDGFDNTDREDKIYGLNASVTCTVDNKPYTVSYFYEQKISSNEYYTYNAHSVSLHFDF